MAHQQNPVENEKRVSAYAFIAVRDSARLKMNSPHHAPRSGAVNLSIQTNIDFHI